MPAAVSRRRMSDTNLTMCSIRNRSLVSMDFHDMCSLYLRHPILTRRPRLHDCQGLGICLVQPNYHGMGRQNVWSGVPGFHKTRRDVLRLANRQVVDRISVHLTTFAELNMSRMRLAIGLSSMSVADIAGRYGDESQLVIK